MRRPERPDVPYSSRPRRGTGYRRRLITACALALVAIVAGNELATAATCWAPPVEAPIRDPYRRPDCIWCAGNRGIEYATEAGQPVRAVAAGSVTFVGAVAGTGYVVVVHADGLRATYGNIDGLTLRAGDSVVGGMRLGNAAGDFHFGLRDGQNYVDPTPMLGRWVRRARLVPIDGARPRPAPPRELVCESLPPVALRR